MTLDRFVRDYWWKKPVILLRNQANLKARRATLKENMLRERGDMKIEITTLEAYGERA